MTPLVRGNYELKLRSRHLTRVAVLLVMPLFVACAPAAETNAAKQKPADESAPDDDPADTSSVTDKTDLTEKSCVPEKTDYTDQEIEELVERLVSFEPAPPHPYQSDVFKPVRAVDAWRKLNRIGLQAFPHLIKKIGDERFSFSHETAGGWRNKSIGEACELIITCHIQPYHPAWTCKADDDDSSDPRSRARRPSYSKQFLGDPAAAAAWWEEHQEKSLRDLQIEAIMWVITEEAKTPEKYSDGERKCLGSTLEKLQTGDQPLKPWWPFPR